jgi:hypothetical protein
MLFGERRTVLGPDTESEAAFDTALDIAKV